MQSLKYCRTKTIAPVLNDHYRQPNMARTVSIVLLLLLSVGGCSRQTEQTVTRTTKEARTKPASNTATTKRPIPASSTAPVEHTNTTAKKPTTASNGKSPDHARNISGHKDPGSDDGLSTRQGQEQAANGLKQAKRLASQGDYTQAFKQALSAWKTLQNLPNNPASQRLVGELRQVMADYGEKLNRKATQNTTSVDTRKPLTVE